MSFLDGLRHRFSVLFRGDSYARETEREFEFHRELAESSRALGNATYYREEVRAMTWQLWVDRIRQDVTYAARGLRRAPGLSVAVVLTIGLGIGVNASMFSLLDRIFLQPPSGLTRPHELRRLYVDFENGKGSVGRLTIPHLQYPQ